MRYFSDFDGQTYALDRSVTAIDNKTFAQLFPGFTGGRRYDGYSMWVGRSNANPQALLPVTRVIEYKRQPSLHVCSAKCVGGKVNGACECSCGGKNHGAGAFRAAYREAA